MSPEDLGHHFVEMLQRAGYSVRSAGPSLSARPLLLTAQRGASSYDLRVFLWRATPGGPPGVRSSNEFRVQTTRPTGEPFLEVRSADRQRYTLLLGYHEDSDVFVAWDVRAHPNPKKSSSLQVTIKDAAATGTGWQVRQTATRSEIVSAWRGSLIGHVLDVLPELDMTLAAGYQVSGSAAGLTGEAIEGSVDEPRRVAVQRVARFVRDARFRTAVIDAYDGACAFCGLGFGVVEAAHIRGVAEGGTDAVENGLAACPNHHEAFDRGLLVVDQAFAPIVNQCRAKALGISADETSRVQADLLSHLRMPSRGAASVDRGALADHYEKWV
jgi:putative restriction endonuclease